MSDLTDADLLTLIVAVVSLDGYCHCASDWTKQRLVDCGAIAESGNVFIVTESGRARVAMMLTAGRASG